MHAAAPTPEAVACLARTLGRDLDPDQARGLARYLELLETWNRKMNLVGPKAWPEMLAELAADSWRLADLLPELPVPPEPLTLDFGAGAGIPGVPLRLFWSCGEYVLVEPRAKRAGFLRQCLAELRLPGTRVFEGRAEDVRRILPPGRDGADLCLSRAFKPWREFLETAGRYRGTGGPGPLAVVFANRPEPDGPPPPDWTLAWTRAYPSRGGTGFFWVFAPVSPA